MSNFKAALWPLLSGDKDEIDLLSTGRSTKINHNSYILKTELRQSVEFQLTSIYEDSQTERATFNLQGQQTARQQQSRQKAQKRVIYKNINYEVLNLTWTLYNINPPKRWFGLLLGVSMVIRLYIFAYLLVILYFTIKQPIAAKWLWAVVIFTTRILYAVLVLRVSLCFSNGPLQTTLKNCWSKRDIVVHEVFEVLTWSIVRKALVKAVIPPELSFLYIAQSDDKRKFLMYSVINYIFLGIEFVIFYPFLLVYCLLSINKSDFSFIGIRLSTDATLVSALAWMCLFLIYSVYLLISGIRIKYKKMTF